VKLTRVTVHVDLATRVSNVYAEDAAFQKDMCQQNALQTGGLFIDLDGQAAQQLGMRVEAVNLAARVLAHWAADLRLK
jgi:hypothetical protein